MKNRILGITVLLAVVVLGLAFMSCPGDTDDRELTFVNKTAVAITITTDAGTANMPKPANKTAASQGGTKDTVTSKGKDIKITKMDFGDLTDSYYTGQTDKLENFITIDESGVTKDAKTGAYGSGTIVFTPASGSPPSGTNNPAQWLKISVIPLD